MGENPGILVTVRLIRNFPHRNIRNIICKNVDTTKLTSAFIENVINDIKTRSELPPPFRTYKYDTMKIQHQAYGAKTNDPVINTTNDEELMLKPEKTLAECGVINETEISFFKLDDYTTYQKDPQLVW